MQETIWKMTTIRWSQNNIRRLNFIWVIIVYFCLDVKIINSELSQSIQTNPKTLFKFNMNNNEHENNKSSNVPNKTKNVNSKQKSSCKFF